MGVKPRAAPASAWEVRVRWGTRRLTAEVLDGRGRTTLRLGDGPGFDIALGAASTVYLEWQLTSLEVELSPGVAGEIRTTQGVRTLSEAAKAGALRDVNGGFRLSLQANDVLMLRIGALTVEIRQARGRFVRLPLDARALILIALALGAVSLLVASMLAPGSLPRQYLLQKGRTE
jgi:hypothetical protein